MFGKREALKKLPLNSPSISPEPGSFRLAPKWASRRITFDLFSLGGYILGQMTI